MANDSFKNNWVQQTTTDRLNDPETPGTSTEDPQDEINEAYDMNDGCVPDSKTAGGNLAKIQDNIRDRFGLTTQDVFGPGTEANKNLY